MPTPPKPIPAANRPLIGVTLGDPAGIGPEVIVKALSDPRLRRQARYVVYGMNELLAYAADLAEIEPFWWRLPHDSAKLEQELTHDVAVLDYDEYSMLGQSLHRPTKQGGAASLQFLHDALAAALRPAGSPGRLDAIVTGPICKESWHLAGEHRYPGHTELLAARTQSRRHAMLFVSPKLTVILATIHIGLMQVREVLSIGKVFDAIDLGAAAMRRLGVDKPRLAVAGLNPHASENGLFGHEEETIIEPAIRMAREQGCDVRGPFPPDTLFIDAAAGKYDLVVAMYHDQGLIPLKLLAFDQAVNVTLGLPIIRTSPDHGTAFDIVGKNKADPGSMKAAIELAIKLARPATVAG
jgi:4-hydroxythreonine-4-phosphate dehydrogenase